MTTSRSEKPPVHYAIRDAKGELPPSYDRVLRALSDEDIVEELAVPRGEPGYQAAIHAEAVKRGLA